MDRQSDRFLIYPLLLGLVPLLYTFSDTFPQFQIEQTYRSIGISLVIVLIVFSFWRIILRSWERAGLVSSWFFMLYFSYGSAYQYMNIHFQESVMSQADILLAIWMTALIIGTWFLIRVLRQTAFLTMAFQITAVILFVFNTFEIGYKAFGTDYYRQSIIQDVRAENENRKVNSDNTGEKRDIYYIILDGYTRSDVLMEIFNLDNSAFIRDLRSRGFFVANQSYTNYSQTLLSLTSSLNMEYLDNLIWLDQESDDRRKLSPLYQQNKVMDIFKQRGYRTYSFDPGVNLIYRNADVYIPRSVQLNEFELSSLKNSMGVFFVETLGRRLYYIDTKKEFANLRKIATDRGPKFVYAHILNPHPPFVMRGDGNIITDFPYKYDDGSYCYESPEDYAYGYSEQAKYVEHEIIQTLDVILSQPGLKPIIILQGDHGSLMSASQVVLENNCFHERMAILNAYYFPDSQTTDLYEGISPANSFRVVLNTYFGGQFKLLEDRHYFALWQAPFKFYEVGMDDLIKTCQPQ